MSVLTMCSTMASSESPTERWEKVGLLWKWTMYVGFKEERAVSSMIWLDIGKDDYSIRVYISNDGKISLNI